MYPFLQKLFCYLLLQEKAHQAFFVQVGDQTALYIEHYEMYYTMLPLVGLSLYLHIC